MSRTRPAALAAVTSVAAASLLATSAAASPAPSWTSERVLDCDGTTVVTYLTPAGFGTPFHVVGSEDVIKPMHVEVILPGETTRVTTLHVPGFDTNQVDTVHCTYTDPAGVFVNLTGLRS